MAGSSASVRGPCEHGDVRIYVAGPLFTSGDRQFVDELADTLESHGHECFVPHRQDFEPFDAATIFSVDSAGVHDAEAMVAWLDGPMIDDGTACEIGIFTELVRTDPTVIGGSSSSRPTGGFIAPGTVG